MLCIGTDGHFLEQAKSYLESRDGVSVVTATSAREAQALLNGGRCEAVICAHSPPHSDALQVFTDLRATGIVLPFIIVADVEDDSFIEAVIRSGADFCLRKSSRPEHVLPELQYRLGQAIAREERGRQLEHRSTMELMITDVCKRVHAADAEHIDLEIQDALHRIGAFAKVRRSFFGLIDDSGDGIKKMLAWPTDLYPEPTKELPLVSLNHLSWMKETLMRGEPRLVSGPEELPSDAVVERSVWQNLGITQMVAVPLFLKGKFRGFFGFSTTVASDPLTAEDMQLLTLLSQAVATRLERQMQTEDLRAEKDKFQAIADYTYNWESWMDTDFKLLWVNPEVERITGYNVEECMTMGDYPFPIILEEDRLMVRGWFEHPPGPEGVASLEFRLRHKDGSVRDAAVSWRLAVSSDGEQLGFRASVEDITERKKMEEELQRAYSQLVTLNHATRHEMTANLRVLRKGIELCASSSGGHTSRLLERMGTSVEKMERLVRTLEDFQNVGTKDPLWQNVEEVACSAFESLPNEMEARVNVGALEILADPLLERAFAHLAENSVIHGGKATRIRVDKRASDEGILLTYRDDGVGIPFNDKPGLFLKDYRHHTARGLVLTQEILGVTGISIRENGAPGEGVRFEMLVPSGRYRIADGLRTR
ncbi:MAG TPA: PAS domain S-box protein [Methanomassiliicoccales archaeon]|nr:PAS domain S-box protein [Methanomassiliicoccales archaeon]